LAIVIWYGIVFIFLKRILEVTNLDKVQIVRFYFVLFPSGQQQAG
jgi:hypothetical protein